MWYVNRSLFVEALLVAGVTDQAALGDIRYDECRQLLVTQGGTAVVEADLTVSLGTETRQVGRDQDVAGCPIDRGGAARPTHPRDDHVTAVRRDEPR